MLFEKLLRHPNEGAVFSADNDHKEKVFNEITIIRAIELTKDKIVKDPMFLLPFTNLYGTPYEKDEKKNTMYHLQKDYCSTSHNNLQNVNNTYIQDAINLAYLYAGKDTDKILKEMDYSTKEHVTFADCEKCVNIFGKSKECNKCNYYKDCIIEEEINDYEKKLEKIWGKYNKGGDE